MHELGSPREHPRLYAATRVLVVTMAASFATLVLAVGLAAAAPANNSQVASVASNQADLGGFKVLPPIVIPFPIPVVLTNLVVTANATWSGDITTNVGWDTDKVRQGQDLDVSRIAPSTSGKINVKWSVTGKIDGFDFGPTNLSKDNISCAPKLSGATLQCDGSSAEIPVSIGTIAHPLPRAAIRRRDAGDRCEVRCDA